MPTPANLKLYEKVKKEVYKRIPTHSAYRSGILVKEYKARGGKYIGKRPTSSGLTRWFKEEWRTQDGEKVYLTKGDIFRPTKRVTKQTPKTMRELTIPEIRRAQQEKKSTGRVRRF